MGSVHSRRYLTVITTAYTASSVAIDVAAAAAAVAIAAVLLLLLLLPLCCCRCCCYTADDDDDANATIAIVFTTFTIKAFNSVETIYSLTLLIT